MEDQGKRMAPSIRKRFQLLNIAAFLLLLVFITFNVNASSTKQPRVNPMCVASHLDRHLTNSDIDTQLTLMQQAGIKWTRFDFDDYVVNPSQGVWDFSTYDNIVQRATAKGISIIAILAQFGLPSYLLNGRQWSTSMQPSEYATFTKAVATHFKGQIPLYEMGNEPNSSMTAASYSALLIAGYRAIKAGDPNAKVISGGLAPKTGTTQDPITFLQQMYANGAKGYFDYFGMHAYSQPQSPDILSQTSSIPTFNILARLKTVLEQEGERTKQIMVTEDGWPTTSDLSGAGVTQATQATYISRVYTKIMHEDYQYVPILCMYDFVNDGTVTTFDEDNFGALNADYSQKSSYTSLQHAASDFSSHFTAISP